VTEKAKVQKPTDPRLPNYILNKDFKNRDGSKRLAGTNGSVITLNPVESVQELIDYMEGKEGGVTSQQKKLVLAEMEKQGYGVDTIKDIITTTKAANMFLLLHEQDHIDNKDVDVYWAQGKDLNTPDKIAIETRASVNALKKLQEILGQPAESEAEDEVPWKSDEEIKNITQQNIPLTNDNVQDPGIGSAQDLSSVAGEFEDYNGNVYGTDQEFQDTDAKLLALMGGGAAPVEEDTSDKLEFSYKGVTIPTEFALTQGQVVALRELIDYVDNDTENSITLQGAAGTGKTAVIGYLQNYLKQSKKDKTFVYMAPTHAATAELAFATVKTGNKKLPMTVQSAVYDAYNRDTKKKQATFTKKAKNRLTYFDNVIVLDEVSLLSADDYRKLVEAATKEGIKVIFMGDVQQLPEVVSGSFKKQVSKAFTDTRQLSLTEVKRTDSSSILSVLTSMRENSIGSASGQIPQVENTESIKYLTGPELGKEITETFLASPENSVYIAYQNSAVKSENQKLRKLLGRTGDLVPQDVIVGYAGYNSKQIENEDIANSVRYVVTNVQKVDQGDRVVVAIKAKSSKLQALADAGVNVKSEATGVYYQLGLSDALTFDEITQDEMEKNNKYLSEKFKELHQKLENAKKANTRASWMAVEQSQLGLSKFFQKTLLGNDYIYNPRTDKMELYDKQKHYGIDSKLKVEKGIDFGHAVTIHKSQGTTVDNVFFNAATLPKSSALLFQGDKQVGTEKHSLAYVGVSRAAKKLVIDSSVPGNFYPLDSKRSSQNVVKPKGKPGIDLNDKDNCG
jgi:hypothetical protein